MAKRPNLLFIMTDDQAAWTLSAEGHPNAYTPQLDRLARRGVVFDHLYANAAVCSPSRGTLITGLYPCETGIAPDGNVVHLKSDSEHGLLPDAATWPKALRDAGYRTALVGKWHMGHAHPHHHPRNHGYEKFSGWLQNGGVSRDPVMEVDGQEKTFNGRYTSDVLADLTLDYIDQFGAQPFAISLHFWAPHANHRVPDDFELPYKDRTWLPMKDEDREPWRDRELSIPHPEFPNLDLPRIQRMTREYHASVHSVDRNVGRIMDYLDKTGLADNTIVIFTSDQGYNMAHNGLWHKGNGYWITKDRQDPAGVYGRIRDNLFNNSLRVPGIMVWPGVTRRGTRVPEYASFVDWFPTIMEMTGTDVPESAPLRGQSIVPLLNGETGERDRGVFMQHAMLRGILDGEWKLVLDFGGRDLHELYHVREDPFEKTNLFHEKNPLLEPVKKRLERRIRKIMSEINDPLLTD